MRLCCLMVLLASCTSSKPAFELLQKKWLPDFSSASAIEWVSDSLILFGDDAPHLLIVDTAYREKNRIRLFESGEKRISKVEKADLEAATLLNHGGQMKLLALASFSAPNRNYIFISPFPLHHHFMKLDYLRVQTALRQAGVGEVNLEGAAFVAGRLVLANRANLSNTVNHLIVVDLNNLQSKSFKIIKLQLPENMKTAGVSGLSYLAEEDCLFFTASTEATASAIADGPIGDSYLGIIKNFSKRMNDAGIKPDQTSNLSQLFPGQMGKLESLAVRLLADGSYLLHLVADNDDGSSVLYKLRWKNRK